MGGKRRGPKQAARRFPPKRPPDVRAELKALYGPRVDGAGEPLEPRTPNDPKPK